MAPDNEIKEWLKRLNDYAKEQKFSTRILDSIADCMEMAERKENSEKLKSAIEELMESIGYKALPVSEKTEDGENFIEEVEAEIERRAKRCRNENEESFHNISERKNAVITKTYHNMEEISHTKAHLGELKNEEYYLAFFNPIKAEYEKDMIHTFKELLQDVSNNYQFMMQHMKSMFEHIGGRKDGLGNRKFYEEYDSQKERIEKIVENEVEQSDFGGKDILEFGHNTKNKIKKIVKKWNAKKRRRIIMPILIPIVTVLMIFTVRTVVTAVIQQKEEAKQEETRQKEAEERKELLKEGTNDKEIIMEKIANYVKGTLSDIDIKPMENTKSGMDMEKLKILILASIFFLLIIVIGYIAYIKAVGRWCDTKICNECGEYLTVKLSEFSQRNILNDKVKDSMQNALEEYERKYLEVLNRIFDGAKYQAGEEKPQEVNQFEKLQEEWNAIKYR